MTATPMGTRWLPLVTALLSVVVLPLTLAHPDDGAPASCLHGRRQRHDRRELSSSVDSHDAASASNEGVGPVYAVYRMLGNDRWPLQGVGQTRSNTAFALAHEPRPPPGLVRQHWILNRIVNTTERALLKALLESRGEEILYPDPPLASVGCVEWHAGAGNESVVDGNMSDLQQRQRREHFATGQNAVRSAIIQHAHDRGYEWAIPLDANQFLPLGFHQRVLGAIEEMKSARGKVAMLIPMLRLRYRQDSDRQGGTHRGTPASCVCAHDQCFSRVLTCLFLLTHTDVFRPTTSHSPRATRHPLFAAYSILSLYRSCTCSAFTLLFPPALLPPGKYDVKKAPCMTVFFFFCERDGQARTVSYIVYPPRKPRAPCAGG